MTAQRLASCAIGGGQKQASITIIVVPRERFSYTQQSLESIYTHTHLPFELVYVDAGSPKHIYKYLQQTRINIGGSPLPSTAASRPLGDRIKQHLHEFTTYL